MEYFKKGFMITMGMFAGQFVGAWIVATLRKLTEEKAVSETEVKEEAKTE